MDVEKLRKDAEFGEMAREIMHEIGAPLSAVSFYVDKIRREVQKKTIAIPVVIDSTDGISNSLSHVKRLREAIEERYEETRSAAEHHTNIYESLKDSLTLCQEALSLHKVTVHLSVPKNLHVKCKRVELSEVWINLIHNACEAMAKKTERWVKVEAEIRLDQKWVRVHVTNSGEPISEAIKQKLFSEQYTSKRGGTGLGLQICKKIIESCGGNITLTPLSENTQFVIELPIHIKSLKS